jgi:hypothetical protein
MTSDIKAIALQSPFCFSVIYGGLSVRKAALVFSLHKPCIKY